MAVTIVWDTWLKPGTETEGLRLTRQVWSDMRSFEGYLSHRILIDQDTQVRGDTMSMHLPKAIALYFTAENSDNPGDLAACFAADATVLDEGRSFEGLAAIKEWKAETKKRYNHRVEALEAEERDGKTVVTSKVSGNFPGSPVILEFSFELEGEKIASLEIH